jgi:hypothetical protein
MRHAVIVTEVISDQAQTRRSVFARFVAALYRSRYLRAERTMQRYRDVIGLAELAIARELKLRSERQQHVDK